MQADVKRMMEIVKESGHGEISSQHAARFTDRETGKGTYMLRRDATNTKVWNGEGKLVTGRI